MLTIIKESGHVFIYTGPEFSLMEEDEIEDYIVSKLNINPLNILWSVTKSVTIKEGP